MQNTSTTKINKWIISLQKLRMETMDSLASIQWYTRLYHTHSIATVGLVPISCWCCWFNVWEWVSVLSLFPQCRTVLNGQRTADSNKMRRRRWQQQQRQQQQFSSSFHLRSTLLERIIIPDAASRFFLVLALLLWSFHWCHFVINVGKIIYYSKTTGIAITIDPSAISQILWPRRIHGAWGLDQEKESDQENHVD